MRYIKVYAILNMLLLLGFVAGAQENEGERLNLPGDNLNLYAVMRLFQESETLEGFEKNLNAEDSKINNLDLNGDDKIDYIKVIDHVNDGVHTIVLQTAVNERENQDIAVFTVQKDSKNNVQIQLIGDEELYGKDYIIEPNYDDNESATETPNPGYTGNTETINGQTVVVTKTTYVEVHSWPLVRFIFAPVYVIWRSPWYWGYYPNYWHPWHPYYWDYYYGYHSHWNHVYYGHYRHAHVYRYSHYNDYYVHAHRSYSATVYNRRQNGMYKSTYSRPDLRKTGSADFKKKYPNETRPATRPGTNRPSPKPSNKPATRPTTQPVNRPTTQPGTRPTTQPSTKPTTQPGNRPTTQPGNNRPTTRPTTQPSYKPATRPTSQPATRPTTRPTSQPATRSETRPSSQPSRSQHTIVKSQSTKSSDHTTSKASGRTPSR